VREVSGDVTDSLAGSQAAEGNTAAAGYVENLGSVFNVSEALELAIEGSGIGSPDQQAEHAGKGLAFDHGVIRRCLQPSRPPALAKIGHLRGAIKSHRMSPVHVRFLGCGDAFCSGGRCHTCFYLEGGGEPLLIDCGATALLALKRAGIDPTSIGSIALSHLHGDHFGALPWLILDGSVSGRQRPLAIAGPRGTEERVSRAFEALYPAGSASFEIEWVEHVEGRPAQLGPAVVTPFEVIHSSGAPSYALRVEYGGKLIAYSGDTEWTDALVEVARGTDLFICECNNFERTVPGHLNHPTLVSHREQFDCKRLLLTHLGEDMLAQVEGIDFEVAEDGMVVEV
jgi:ribonuclease BN (tRNA processing enzyme)